MSLSAEITVAARSSPLSRKQVEEVQEALLQHHIDKPFSVSYIDTIGDKSLDVSLRSFDKTDFFTKEIDAMILSGEARIAVHSAKDLPDPLPAGLAIVALTKGLDPSDALVLREGESLESLPSGARIATSSVRREEAVRSLRSDLVFVDVRGTIGQRLAKLTTREADGVVVAEAALIRLGLTALNRLRLPGPTVEGQGRLAVIARADDLEMKELFRCLDS